MQRQIDLLPGCGLERDAIALRRVVLDVDDAIWLDTLAAARGSRLARLKRSAYKVRWIAGRADVVLAGNEILAEWLSRYARDVHVVPSLVEHREVPVRTHADGDRLVLGWIGSPSTAPYLTRVRSALAELPARLGGRPVELVVLGGDFPPLHGIDIRVEPWSERAECTLLGRMDIGLMPLVDTPWARGKCAYKALQYMASGVPVVADDVGVSARVVGDGFAGLVPPDEHGWLDALATLAESVALRQRLGANGRARVAADYSVARWAPTMASLFTGGSSVGR